MIDRTRTGPVEEDLPSEPSHATGDDARYATVVAAESEAHEEPSDIDRAAEIVASMADATLLKSVAAVILGFVVLTLGSVVAGRWIASASAVSPDAPLTTAFLTQNLVSRLVVAGLAGYLTATAAPKRPFLHGAALAGMVGFLAAAALFGLLAAGTMEDPRWYPVVMLVIGPAGVLVGAWLRDRRATSAATDAAES